MYKTLIDISIAKSVWKVVNASGVGGGLFTIYVYKYSNNPAKSDYKTRVRAYDVMVLY